MGDRSAPARKGRPQETDRILGTVDGVPELNRLVARDRPMPETAGNGADGAPSTERLLACDGAPELNR
jgi:hypothetical protein